MESDAIVAESIYTPDNVKESLQGKGINIPEQPDNMCENDREKDSWILFAEVYDQAEQAFGEEWTDSKETINTKLNESIAVANETMRKIGYHDKTHAIRFAAAYLAQAVAVRQMINAGNREGLEEFISARIGGNRLSRESSDGDLMWQLDNGESVDAVAQLQQEFGVGHVFEVMCAGFEHDMAEKDSSKEAHEALAAEEMVSKGQLERARMVLATRYVTGKRNVLNSCDHLDAPIAIYPSGNEDQTKEEKDSLTPPLANFNLQTDSIATHLSARMFGACDYIEMFARDSYVDQNWLSIAGMQELLPDDKRPEAENLNASARSNLAELRVALHAALREGNPSTIKVSRERMASFAEQSLQNYPLALLWAENFMKKPEDAIAFANSFDLGIGIADMGFPKFQLHQHRSSLSLIENSNLNQSIKGSLTPKVGSFDERIKDRWMTSPRGLPIQRMVSFFLDLNSDVNFTQEERRAIVELASFGESWLMSMVAISGEPKNRFNFGWISEIRAGNSLTRIPPEYNG